MQTPFNILIVGMTTCGKTICLLNMLEKDYNKHFDFIILICPMLEWKYIKDNDFIAIQCEQTQVTLC